VACCGRFEGAELVAEHLGAGLPHGRGLAPPEQLGLQVADQGQQAVLTVVLTGGLLAVMTQPCLSVVNVPDLSGVRRTA